MGEIRKKGEEISKGEDRKFQGKEEKKKRKMGKKCGYSLVRAGCQIVLYSRWISVLLGDNWWSSLLLHKHKNNISIMVRVLSLQNHRFSLEILSSPLRVKCLFGTDLRALIIIKVTFCLEIFLTLLLFLPFFLCLEILDWSLLFLGRLYLFLKNLVFPSVTSRLSHNNFLNLGKALKVIKGKFRKMNKI